MSNNVSISIRADVADLIAKRAILSTELKGATKDLNDLAKAAKSGMSDELKTDMLAAANAVSVARAQIAAVDKETRALAVTQQASRGMTDQQRAGFQQLGYNLGDFSTMVALTGRPMQAFISQSGQVVQAVQLMAGGTSKFAAFLGGP